MSASPSAVCAGLSCLQARPLRKLHSSAGLPCLARTKLGPAGSFAKCGLGHSWAHSLATGHTGDTGHQGNSGNRGLTDLAIISTCEEVKAERKNERGLRDLPFEMVCAFKDQALV